MATKMPESPTNTGIPASTPADSRGNFGLVSGPVYSGHPTPQGRLGNCRSWHGTRGTAAHWPRRSARPYFVDRAVVRPKKPLLARSQRFGARSAEAVRTWPELAPPIEELRHCRRVVGSSPLLRGDRDNPPYLVAACELSTSQQARRLLRTVHLQAADPEKGKSAGPRAECCC